MRGSTTRFELTGPDGSFSVETIRKGRSLEIKVNGKTFLIALEQGSAPGEYVANIDGKPVEFELIEASGTSVSLKIGGEKLSFQKAFAKLTKGKTEAAPREDLSGSVVAPMPGRIVRVMVKVGQRVKPGDPLVALESMKMESILRSARKGEVGEVAVSEGDSVKRGQLLVRYKD